MTVPTWEIRSSGRLPGGWAWGNVEVRPGDAPPYVVLTLCVLRPFGVRVVCEREGLPAAAWLHWLQWSCLVAVAIIERVYPARGPE